MTFLASTTKNTYCRWLVPFVCVVLLSCEKNKVSEKKEDQPSSYVEIAVISPDHSERICQMLESHGIVSFASGTNLYVLYVNKLDAPRALQMIQKLPDWNQVVWDLPKHDPNYEPIPLPVGPGFPK
jgi:hemolysin-activating ACP:hemolysin acyltransferase